jgi:NAD(P)-dependent dehydrogenase (short-subunit alcohol dehydrogenase family)
MNVKEMYDLKGKVAVVTGGGRGIGKFIAEGLAEAGASLVIASRKLANCEKAAQEMAKLGVKTLAVKCDTASEEDITGLVNTTVKEFGTIDILVNNAGITWGAPTLEFPLDKWDKIFAVNVRGVWILTQKTANVMKEKGGGKVINISSIFGSRGSIEEGHPAVAYNPSKAAIEVLTKNLAVKLARYNIMINCIAPGFFRTDMMEYIFKPEMKPILDLTVAQIPLLRYGEEDQIKGLAVFLASKASDFMTGAVIPLDGGMAAK